MTVTGISSDWWDGPLVLTQTLPLQDKLLLINLITLQLIGQEYFNGIQGCVTNSPVNLQFVMKQIAT